MKRFMGLKLLEGFKRKRNIMGEMQNIEDHFVYVIESLTKLFFDRRSCSRNCLFYTEKSSKRAKEVL